MLTEVDRAELTGEAVTLTLRDDTPASAASVNRQFVAGGLEVSELRATRRSLQEVFLDLTGSRTGGAIRCAARGEAGRSGQRSGACAGPDAGKDAVIVQDIQRRSAVYRRR